MQIKQYIIDFFKKGHERSIKARKNIVASIIIKGASVVIGFLLVPITLDYLDKTRYGIWVTISSFLIWFTFFEVGLGNGLRNKLAIALAKKDYHLGKILVSTTYAILTLIISSIALLFFITNRFIDWTKILNTSDISNSELSLLALIVFGLFFFRFILKLINMVLLADQRPAVVNSFGPIGNLLALITIYILTKTTDSSLIYLGLTLSIAPLIVLFIATIFFYSKKYQHISPSIKYVRFKYVKGLLNLGFKFFIIQISALVIFQTSNFIIAQYFGPEQVTPYSITYQYFSIITMLFSLIMTPFWSAFTEAWTKKEYFWIKNTIKNLIYLWFIFVIIAVIMYFISNPFFNFWIGKEKMSNMLISNNLKLLLLLYVLLHSFGGVFNMFINGVGKIKLQTFALLFGTIIFIPTAILLIKYSSLGIESIVVATIIANFYTPFIAPIQYLKIIKKKAHGIWNK